MKRLIMSLLMAFVLFSVLLIATAQVGMAAKWHLNHGMDWTIGRACRDGAVFIMKPPIPYTLIANSYKGSFASYPVLLDDIIGAEYPDVDSTQIGAQIGAFQGVPLTHTTALLFDSDGRTDYSYQYTVGVVKWNAMNPGATIAVANQITSVHYYFMVKVENCYLSPTATSKSPSLRVRATVGSSPDLCSTQRSISVFPTQKAYACLIVENPGDVIFEQQTITHTLTSSGKTSSLSISFPLTVPPGSLISITHSIAQQVGLPFNLGSLNSGIHTFTWQAKGGAFTASGQASITVSGGILGTPTKTPAFLLTPTATPSLRRTATPTPTSIAVFATDSTPSPESNNQIFLPLVSK